MPFDLVTNSGKRISILNESSAKSNVTTEGSSLVAIPVAHSPNGSKPSSADIPGPGVLRTSHPPSAPTYLHQATGTPLSLSAAAAAGRPPPTSYYPVYYPPPTPVYYYPGAPPPPANAYYQPAATSPSAYPHPSQYPPPPTGTHYQYPGPAPYAYGQVAPHPVGRLQQGPVAGPTVVVKPAPPGSTPQHGGNGSSAQGAGVVSPSVKKYTCHCMRSFTTSGHLARHMRIHTGEKNYLCPFEGCGARFSRQDNCMQHYRTHMGGRGRLNRKRGGSSNGGSVSKKERMSPSSDSASSPTGSGTQDTSGDSSTLGSGSTDTIASANPATQHTARFASLTSHHAIGGTAVLTA